MIKKEESYFKSFDNHRLYYESFHPKKYNGILIFVHGLNEHCGRYVNPVEHFVDEYAIFLFDHRGHGKSDGIRSYVNSFDEYVDDVNEFVKFVQKQHEGEKIFIVGHSMGGQVVLNYLAKYQPKLAGFMTSSANIKLGWNVNPVKRFIGMVSSDFIPKLRLPNEVKPKWISTDKHVVKAYQKDPLVNKNITVKLAVEILLNQENICSLAPKIKLPGLMMHGGDDRICSRKGSEDFYKELGSSDKELKIYAGMYHEIFNEIHKEHVFEDMSDWLEDHV